MSSTIFKIFNNELDQEVHDSFLKFSRGLFPDRYLLSGKKQKDKWVIKTGNEYTNYLVKYFLGKESKFKIKGVIVATFDISEKADFEIKGVKQFMGIKQAVVDGEIESQKIIKLMNEYPRAFYALTFSGKDFELKVKPKAPKSAKPSTKGEKGAVADFCSLKTTDKKIIEDIFFDNVEFNTISVRHSVQIDKIEIPQNEKDPVKMRENSIREGKIIRMVVVDDKEKTSEAKFRI